MKYSIYLLILSLLSLVKAYIIPQHLFQDTSLNIQQPPGYVEVIQDGNPTLGDIIPTDKSLGTFLDALMRFPDLANVVFNAENELTVVAPVNSAFQKTNIAEHFDDLHEIVASHIITKIVSLDSLKDGAELPTLNQNKPVRVDKVDGRWVINGNAHLVDKVKKASNGNLYKIDAVFL
ncbi:hypothetical protein K7432_014031 [Basidiobolus ranarum]|uniref:FAS1 domain-containing protein n=1 Tax=Basidiobolus ranarum TaxID=34480 RepID=A0ABR2VQ01_9FUNG